jgi:predicted DCC family thiol-disulfide oxidoreductase YuxK
MNVLSVFLDVAMSQSDQFQVFFDGDCPLCKREIDWLRRRDRNHQIKFVDIADPQFDEVACGKTYAELMAEIHGRLPDGQWVKGVEVFRHLYNAAGFGFAVHMSRLPVVRFGLDIGYRVFARYRTRLTGRCKDGVCRVPTQDSRQSSESHSSDRLAKESAS